jgi:glycosidase
MNFNSSIYEINTRLWLRRFDEKDKISFLKDVPKSFWDNLVKKGIDYVWLMGIWKTCDSTIEKYCFEENLVINYKRSLKDWTNKDVIGSPFAIDVYDINPKIGDRKTLLQLKSFLNKKGIRLILDFVPNHFSSDSSLIKSLPGLFLQVDKEFYERDPHTFYKPIHDEEKYFAHGRDPFFPAWQDTIQVNYFTSTARKYLMEVLIELTKVCDGVRCDMSMLMLNNVFKNTWGGLNSKNKINLPAIEFWKEAVSKVKKARKDFLFIAEAYWDLEWELQQLGFDYTYDKKLTDRLKSSSAKDIYEHLQAEEEYQTHSLRFIENHDEERAVSTFGKEKSKAAAIVISTIQGLRFYFDGQLEGKKIKLPVQLGREPDEPINNDIQEFYEKLFSIVAKDVFKKGKWNLLTPISSWPGNNTQENILTWMWTYKNDKRLIVINYSDKISTCRIKLDVRGYDENFVLIDLLNNKSYVRSTEEVYHSGLYIELKPYHAHIFGY